MSIVRFLRWAGVGMLLLAAALHLRPADPLERRETRLSIRKNQNPADQPCARGPRRRQRGTDPGFRLVDRPGQPASYPGIAADYRRTFSILENLPCDIFLGGHGMYFGMLEKLNRIRAGARENVWVDPTGYQAAVAERKAAFETELTRQQQP